MADHMTLVERIPKLFAYSLGFTAQYAAEKLGCSKQGAIDAIWSLHADGMLYITRWYRSGVGRKAVPMFRLKTSAAQKDAQRSKPLGQRKKRPKRVGRPRKPRRVPDEVKLQGTKAAVKDWFAERRDQ